MDEQLKHLFDYTKFHIGMYTTLVAAIIGVFATDSLKGNAYVVMIPFLGISVVLFLLAGMCGGLVASSIPFFTTFKSFAQAKLAPWSTEGDKGIPSILCTHLEHLFFWLGCVIAVIGLLIALATGVPDKKTRKKTSDTGAVVALAVEEQGQEHTTSRIRGLTPITRRA